ncbi:WASH complex subunit 2-like [Lingula anatina]|uniref:WASH complex subunit 2-like n=1 Tax=Lingula anatina TaxID=7574 RepID=A0A2R2MNQ6_LINAN|nr:WASH complex subunit 2-like [Lingula anatina]|eukprot:XP_023931850.1 WASH complex subunit 2-like [Lingula anatina]
MPKAAAQKRPSLSIFSNDDDEDGGDLFGGATSVPKTEASKPQEVKSRSKSKMLFEDEDILFGGGPTESPDVDLFGAASPVGSPTQTKPIPAKQPTEPAKQKVSIKGATVSSSTTDLFGSPRSDDDLFSPSKPKAKEPDPALPVKGATVTESSTDLFGKSPSQDDDLFGEKKQEKGEEEPVKPKKPIGGVSMFGGFDPTAATKGLKKTRGASKVEEERKEAEKVEEKKPTPAKKIADPLFGGEDEDEGDLFGGGSAKASKPVEEKPKKPAGGVSLFGAGGEEDGGDLFGKPAAKKEEKPPEAEVSKPKKPVGGVSMFGGFDPSAFKKKETKEEEKNEDSVDAKPEAPISSPPKPQSNIGRLQAGLAFNPAALLPGAAPVAKEPETVAVGFDQPMSTTSTLQNAAKGRAKVQQKRRPPSRQARQAAARQAEQDFVDGVGAMTTAPSAVSVTTGTTTTVIRKVPQASSAPTSNKPVKDIFGNDDLVPEGKAGQGQGLLQGGEDIFDAGFGNKPKSAEKKVTNFDDDLFGAAKNVPTPAVPPSSQVTQNDKDDIFSEPKKTAKASSILDDDLFGDSVLNKPPPSSKSVGKAKPSGALLDDDIFADSSLNSKKDEKKEDKKATKAAKQEELFGDEDMFAAAAASKAAAKKQKEKPKTRDEDIFQDDTDIFADIPAAKPKEKKSKKKTGSKTDTKPLFKGDVDDIFADTDPKPKTKKTSKGTKKKTSPAEAANIFDENAPSIFDDPLNAMN